MPVTLNVQAYFAHLDLWHELERPALLRVQPG